MNAVDLLGERKRAREIEPFLTFGNLAWHLVVFVPSAYNIAFV